MAKSTRASCAIAQKPLFTRIGIFVEAIATHMSMMSGIAASRVTRPRMRSAPPAISTMPTNGARSSGAGIPILTNRPTPSASG